MDALTEQQKQAIKAIEEKRSVDIKALPQTFTSIKEAQEIFLKAKKEREEVING